jgi:chaperone required for assembly of F1-ATPase
MTVLAPQPQGITAEAFVAEDGAIYCNGVIIKTPAGSDFIVPTPALAEAIAREWHAQDAKLNPRPMPVTQLAATAIDIIAKDRGEIINQVMAYAENELLCHHAEHPPELVARQQEIWLPVLDWCRQRFDAPLRVGIGVMPVAQAPETLLVLRRAVESYDNFRLAGFRSAVEISGSFVLGLAMIEKHLTLQQVFAATELDELFQIQKWGEDPVIVARHESVKRDLTACIRWFDLLLITDQGLRL